MHTGHFANSTEAFLPGGATPRLASSTLCLPVRCGGLASPNFLVYYCAAVFVSVYWWFISYQANTAVCLEAWVSLRSLVTWLTEVPGPMLTSRPGQHSRFGSPPGSAFSNPVIGLLISCCWVNLTCHTSVLFPTVKFGRNMASWYYVILCPQGLALLGIQDNDQRPCCTKLLILYLLY